MQIKCYVAAPWQAKEDAKVAKKALEDAGFMVTSRWIDFHEEKSATGSGLDYDPKVLKTEAAQDVEDVYDADILILLNSQKRGEETSGKAVETGLAMAWFKPVILIGEPTNIFHFLFEKVSDVQGAIDLIHKWEANRPRIVTL